MCNLTWKFPVDLGFRYLIRLHFCEPDFGVKESGQREFSIFVNNKTAEARADLIKWSCGNGVAINYEPMAKYHTGAVLNGLEVFKLSNPDSSLAGQNLKPLAHVSAATTPKLLKVLSGFGNGHTIVSGLIILITLLNIIVYKLRLWAENVGMKEVSVLSKSEEECRRFSLSEIQMTTNTFDDELVIGDSGFGMAYNGLIDEGSIIVAVKRLKSMSKQGAQDSPNNYYPVDDIAGNCGSTGNSISLDIREWIGDVGSQFTSTRQPNGKAISSKEFLRSFSANPIPYMTAQFSHSQFAITFQVSYGQEFIRLHFYPASYPGFEKSKAFFAVKAGAYTPLNNFSASLTADALAFKSFTKEFCVNVEENQALSITFVP
ncbi:hypothetical protein Acr_00g0012190 [Actinidia rufa]|uniref:Malectin-like domain-containing protein n=1 Tax=Actinidia rufa TaxID=165716 RepID=A0A7J0D9N5_9ERIC|nr:hypothetical protein Acr_00g0012190 [Actinidia rufa]